MNYKFLLGILLLVFLVGCSTGNTVANDDYVSIPLSEFSITVQHQQYDYYGTNVRFIATLGSDGLPRIAFDACDVCGDAGYTQVGTDVRCNNCGRMFSIDGLGSKNKGAGCWPSYLPMKIEGENVLIKKSDLESGVNKFR